jgi:hypothetical protein
VQRASVALTAAVRRRDSTLIELQAAIEGCVRSLRDQGMTAGAVIITMKAFVRHAMQVAPPLGFVLSADAVAPLMDRIVTWCIDEFYRTRVLS